MRSVKVGEVFTLIGGGTPSTKESDYWGEGTPWISSADITLSNRVTYSRYVTDRGIKESTTNRVPKGSLIVVTRVGLGKVCISPVELCFSQDMQALIPKSEDIPYVCEYFLYQLKYLMSQEKYHGQGTTISGITKKHLADMLIAVPPLGEQQRIVSLIEELFSELDNSVATLQKTKAQLAVYRQAVLTKVFSEIGVERVPFKLLLEKPRYGTSKKCSSKDVDSTKVYRIPNINYKFGTIDKTDLKYATFSDEELLSLSLQSGDILLIRSNCSTNLVGRTAVVTENDTDATYAGYLIRLRLKVPSLIGGRFYHYYFESIDARLYIEMVSKSTSGVNHINADEVGKLLVPNCEYEVMERACGEIESRLSVYDQIEATVDTALAQAESLRQSILKQAFEGRL